MKLFLLLYADDTVIFAESQQELQQILKMFEHYCNIRYGNSKLIYQKQK
jgi:hypothetical protein